MDNYEYYTIYLPKLTLPKQEYPRCTYVDPATDNAIILNISSFLMLFAKCVDKK